ncbi:putative amino acid permease [Nocardioides baekrokdamisoli]|uniref:Putative amino acid permease n=1 Tax=Nocardioides baekrokdamisoli TaxID=1804624 RepID=A0A3G9IXT7_9ACTN|nr:APC family permease [Nocardioides baekrokdamisoli]BBH17223.1 putative amino acid permease [Nocardioides baekrokdamisoli]
MSTTTTLTPASSREKGLKRGAVGLVGSVVVGIASTAPAYSLAATLGLVVVSGAGLKAPAIMLLAFIPMYFIAVAYKELNEAEPDCGTTFTWASRAFGPIVGFMGGWGIVISDIIVMANLAQIAGKYSFTLANESGIHNTLDQSTLWSTIAGVIWIAVMTYICFRGIEVSARLQYALLGIEIVTLSVFAAVALIKVYAHHATASSLHPSLSWLWPGGLGMSAIASTVLLAVFIYWGWDTAVSINEESDDPGRTPGRAAVISTVMLLLIYVLVTVAAIAYAGVGTDGIGLGNGNNGSDVFSAIGPSLYGHSALGHIGLALLAITILTSSAASTQTTILPTARTALSMASHRAIPTKFATIHKRFLTPTWATIGMGVVSIVFYVAMTLISQNLLNAIIGAIGLQIAFYYGLTGIACFWFYRKQVLTGLTLFTRVLFPLLGAIFLFVMFFYAAHTYLAVDYLADDAGNNVTIWGYGAVGVVGIVSLLFGFVLMALQWAFSPDYFRGKTLPRRSAEELSAEDLAADIA